MTTKGQRQQWKTGRKKDIFRWELGAGYWVLDQGTSNK